MSACSSPAACLTPPLGLVSWWRGETNALDSVGTNHGTLQNGTGFLPGEVGEGFNFDGINDYMLVNASASLDVGLGSGLTFEGWINPATVDTQMPIVEYERDLGTFDGNDVGVHFYVAGGGAGPGSLFANVKDIAGGDHFISSSPGLVAAGVWQHVALTYDKASGIAAIHLNGVALEQYVGSFTPRTSFNLVMGARTTFGSASNPSDKFSGQMDEWSLYNRALTQAEIQSIDNAGSAGKCSPDNGPCFLINDVTVVEGDTAVFTVIFTGSISNLNQNFPINYSISNGTATAKSDYVAETQAGTLFFRQGVLTNRIFVHINTDLEVESNETFFVNLLSPATYNATICRSPGVCTILDGTVPPTLTISDAQVLEGDIGTTNMVFTASLSRASPQTISVDFSTAGGTALAGSDYVPTNGTLTFQPGITTTNFSVLVRGDTDVELDETFFLQLTNPQLTLLGTNLVTGTIRNDDNHEKLTVAITSPADGDIFYAPPGLIPIVAVTEVSGPDIITFGEIAHDIGNMGPVVEKGYQYEGVGSSWSVQGGYGPDGNALLTFWGIPPMVGNILTFKRVDGSPFRFLSLELRGRIQGARNDVVMARGFLNGVEVASQVLQSSNEAWRIEFANTSFVAPIDTLKFELVESNLAALIFDNLTVESAQVTPCVAQRVDFFATPTYYLGASTNPPFTVQWSNSIPGSYALTAIATTGSGATATSAPVRILIVPCSGSLTASSLADQTACVCEAVVFTALASSADPLSFLWRANGRPIPGQTRSNLVLQSLKASDAGIYTVEISTTCKKLTNSATLTIGGDNLPNPLVLTNSSLITINDYSSATPYPSIIDVQCVPGPIKKVTAALFDLTHTSTHDIDMLLVNPADQGIKLMSDAGRSAANVDLTFSDSASASVPAFPAEILSGLYKPTDYGDPADDVFPGSITYVTNFAGFNGTSPNGTWGLFVQDDEFLDTGTIARGWSLTIDWDDSAPRVSFPPTLMDGRLQMVLKSQAGRTHIIEASTDLQSWFPLSTNTMIGTNMSIVFPDAHVHPHRFFRVIRCPNIDLSR